MNKELEIRGDRIRRIERVSYVSHMHFHRSLIFACEDSTQNVNRVFRSASLCTADVKHIRPSDLLMHTLLLFSELELNKGEQQTNALHTSTSSIVRYDKINPAELIKPSHHKRKGKEKTAVDT